MTANTAPQHYRDTCTRCIDLEKKISELNALAKKKKDKPKQSQFYSLTIKRQQNPYMLLWNIFSITIALIGIVAAITLAHHWLIPVHIFAIWANLPFKIVKVPVEPLHADDQSSDTTTTS